MPRIVTGRGNSAWPSYSDGWLVFTSDRGATREQRKPQQVFLLSLDAPQAAYLEWRCVPAPAAARQRFDFCLPIVGGVACRSTGARARSWLALLALKSAGPDPILLASPLITPIAEACRDNAGPAALCALLDRFDTSLGLSRYVDPRIGSTPPGFTNPGAGAAVWHGAARARYGRPAQLRRLLSAQPADHRLQPRAHVGRRVQGRAFSDAAVHRRPPRRRRSESRLGWPIRCRRMPRPSITLTEMADAGYYARRCCATACWRSSTATSAPAASLHVQGSVAGAARADRRQPRARRYGAGQATLRMPTARSPVGTASTPTYPCSFAARANAPFTAHDV